MVTNGFKIKFDGEQHQINANVLISNLIQISSIIQEINKELNTGKKIEIKIKALEKGSFLIGIGLEETTLDSLKNLLTKENIFLTASIIEIIVGIIQIKQFLKGRKEKSKSIEGDKVKIENENGDNLYITNFTYNIYEHNAVVKDAVAESFETIEKELSITGYEILGGEGEKTLLRVERNDFEYLSLKSDDVLEGERIISEITKLNIVKVSFDGKSSWVFYFKGNKISAKIEDPDFHQRIDNGETFAKGDILEVELHIKQRFDKTVNTYVNKSYKIQKIKDHIKRLPTPKLNLEE